MAENGKVSLGTESSKQKGKNNSFNKSRYKSENNNPSDQ